MVINRKVLLRGAAVVVALFAIAFPLGDAHHGIGAHHARIADLGDIVFGAFLVSAVLLVVLAVVGAVQLVVRRRRG